MAVRNTIGGPELSVDNPAVIIVDINGVPAALGGGGGGGGTVVLGSGASAVGYIGASFSTTSPVVSLSRTTALSTSPIIIKSSAGRLHGWRLINLNSIPVYVKIWDAASVGVVTVGTTVPKSLIDIPATGYNTHLVSVEPQESWANGLVIAAVTGIEDTSTAAPTTPIYAELRFV